MTQTPKSSLTHEEAEQMKSTVALYEAIVDSNPLDHQAWSTLKEAYERLGQEADVQKAWLGKADAYRQMGMPRNARAEFELMLSAFPENEQAQAALRELPEFVD